MKSLCGTDCANCQWKSTCNGCSDEKCFIARYIKTGGMEKFEEFKHTLIEEFNALGVPGIPKIDELYALVGHFVNLEYPLPGGQKAKFLDDSSIYLGNQVECEFGEGRCYGLLAGPDFLLVSEYGENCADPQIVMFVRR